MTKTKSKRTTKRTRKKRTGLLTTMSQTGRPAYWTNWQTTTPTNQKRI